MLSETTNYLKNSIAKTVDVIGGIEIGKVQALHQLEDRVRQISPDLVDEIQHIEDAASIAGKLEPLIGILDKLAQYIADMPQGKMTDLAWLKDRATTDLAVGTFVDANEKSIPLMKAFERLFEALQSYKTCKLELKNAEYPMCCAIQPEQAAEGQRRD